MAGNKQNLKYKNVLSGDRKGGKEVKEEDIGNYLGRSLEKLNLGSSPRKKLLVLSLNGLIIYRVHLDGNELIPKNRRPDTQYLKFFGNFTLLQLWVSIYSPYLLSSCNPK